jgi:ribosomal protein S13
MSDERELYVDPNTADQVSLMQLPGIGRGLARRIVAARPFESVEDLRNVVGLGEETLARIRPYLQIGDAESESSEIGGTRGSHSAELGEETGQGLDLGMADIRNDAGQATDRIKKAAVDAGAGIRDVGRRASERVADLPEAVRRVDDLWQMLGTGVTSILLSVILTLTILAGINRTLNFGQHPAVRQMQTELARLQSDLAAASSRQASMSQRLQALEGLTGRMRSVEGQLDSMQAQVEGSRTQIETMQKVVDELSQKTESLAGRVDRFDTFLDGLNRLLSGLFGPNQPEAIPSP